MYVREGLDPSSEYRAHAGSAASPEVERTVASASHAAGDGRATFPSRRRLVEGAAELDKRLKSERTLSNQVRLCQIDDMFTMHETKMYKELAYSNFAHYCEDELNIKGSTAYEYVRVSRALDELPRMLALFYEGHISWEVTREITKVAIAETDAVWAEFAVSHRPKVVVAEVAQALRSKRSAPRDRKFGLPNVVVRHLVDLSLENKERLYTAATLCPEVPGQESGPRDLGSVMLRIVDAILAGRLVPHDPKGDIGSKPAPAQTIVYVSNVATGKAVVLTDDGEVVVPQERIRELEGQSDCVEIPPEDELEIELVLIDERDGPNSAELIRKVLHRDGMRCAVAGCRQRHQLNAHHIIWRSRGGRTVMSNEITICSQCHALVHVELLRVSGTPSTGLTWTRHPMSPDAELRDPEKLRQWLRELEAALPEQADRPVGGAGTAPRPRGPRPYDDVPGFDYGPDEDSARAESRSAGPSAYADSTASRGPGFSARAESAAMPTSVSDTLASAGDQPGQGFPNPFDSAFDATPLYATHSAYAESRWRIGSGRDSAYAESAVGIPMHPKQFSELVEALRTYFSMLPEQGAAALRYAYGQLVIRRENLMEVEGKRSTTREPYMPSEEALMNEVLRQRELASTQKAAREREADARTRAGAGLRETSGTLEPEPAEPEPAEPEPAKPERAPA
jgi:hypothetical protein